MNELQRLQSRVACFAALAFFGVVLMLLGFARQGSDLFDEMTGGLLALV